MSATGLDGLRERPPRDGVVLLWLGQSGFAIRHADEVLVVDPYLSDSLTTKYAATATPHVRIGPRVAAPDELALLPVIGFAATHQHTDHLDAGTLRPALAALGTRGAAAAVVAPEAWRALAAERSGRDATEIVGMDDGEVARVGEFELTGVAAAHDVIERDDRGHVKCLGYVVRVGTRTIYHSGDTLAYDGLADRVRSFDVDVALLPINGKVGNMSGLDAARLARAAGVGVVVPCHYGMFTFNTADPADAFVPECRRLGQACRVLALGGTLAL